MIHISEYTSPEATKCRQIWGGENNEHWRLSTKYEIKFCQLNERETMSICDT